MPESAEYADYVQSMFRRRSLEFTKVASEPPLEELMAEENSELMAALFDSD